MKQQRLAPNSAIAHNRLLILAAVGAVFICSLILASISTEPSAFGTVIDHRESHSVNSVCIRVVVPVPPQQGQTGYETEPSS